MSKIMTVISAEEGTGKTTTVAAVSSSLAILGYKTLCISVETGICALERALCIDVPAETYFLDDPPETEKIIDATFEHNSIDNLFYINAQFENNPDEILDFDVLPFLTAIRDDFDFCIIDTQLEMNAISKLLYADTDIALVVTTEEESSLHAAHKLVRETRDSVNCDVQILVNKINTDDFITKWERVDRMLEAIDAKLVGAVLTDDLIPRAVNEHTPLILYKKKLAIYDFMDTARRIMGETIRWPFQRRTPVFTSIIIKGISTSLKGSYGDPKEWAKSTLLGDKENLVKVFQIKPGGDVTPETIRNKTWIHELLDVEGIKYKVVIAGYWATPKKYLISQSIMVEPENRKRAKELIPEDSNIDDDVWESEDETIEKDKLPQITCPSCGGEIDFDHIKCPLCKASL